MGFLMTWMVRLVDPSHRHPAQLIEWVHKGLHQLTLRLPLPEEAPLHFRMLPEYLIENVAEYYDYLAQSVER